MSNREDKWEINIFLFVLFSIDEYEMDREVYCNVK